MITNKFSQALAPLLTTANIISPTTNLDKETQLHLPTDPTAGPFNVSYKPNIDSHPSKVFSVMIDDSHSSSHRRPWKNRSHAPSKSLWDTSTPPTIPPRKQFKPTQCKSYVRTCNHPSSPHRHFHRSRSTMETTSRKTPQNKQKFYGLSHLAPTPSITK